MCARGPMRASAPTQRHRGHHEDGYLVNKFEVSNMDLYYGSFHALKNININIPEREITAFIGPSGCGKSTFLKSLNRMNDLVEGCRITGDIKLDGVDIYDKMDVNRPAQAGGHGVPEAQPLPHEHLRQHRLRPPHPRHHAARRRAGRDRGEVPAGRRHLGRGQGPPEEERPGHVRRPAAAPVHRPRPGCASRKCC